MTTPTFRSVLSLTALPILLSAGVAACGSTAPAPAAPATTAAPASTAEPAPTAAPAPEPTAEEKAKAEEAAKLAADQVKMRAEAQAELARFTPELRAEAAKLAGATYYSVKAGIVAAQKSAVRKPEHAARDAHRHPVETLEFIGIKPTHTVLEVGPGGGWYTELLAPTLAARGKLLVTTTDPNGPQDTRPTFYAERLKLMLDKSPELFGKVERVVHSATTPDLGIDGKVDVAIVFRHMHGWHTYKVTETWLAEIHQALKPGGTLGIEQHRAKADANPDESVKGGYLPEAFVIAQVEAAGFKLAGKSEVNANPKDTKDHPDGVWALLPSLRHGDKYAAIGESDRMTLKFTKVVKK